MASHLIFVTQRALLVEHPMHHTQTPELSNRYITEPRYYVLPKLLQTPKATYYPNYCRLPVLGICQITIGPQCYVLSKLLQNPKGMQYQNYCRPSMLRIIKIIADPKRYVLSKLLQTSSAMYYPNYCRLSVLCVIQITADSQHNVILHITASYTLIQ
jgi:hypothetical protein